MNAQQRENHLKDGLEERNLAGGSVRCVAILANLG